MNDGKDRVSRLRMDRVLFCTVVSGGGGRVGGDCDNSGGAAGHSRIGGLDGPEVHK